MTLDALIHLFDNSWSARLYVAFLHLMWQGTLLVALLIVARRLINRPDRRYAAGLICLLAMPVCVITNLLVVPPSGSPRPVGGPAITRADLAATQLGAVPATTISSHLEAVGSAARAEPDTSFAPILAPESTGPAADSIGRQPPPQRTTTNRWAARTIAFWVIGVTCMSLRLMMAFVGGRRIVKTSQHVVDEGLVATLQQQAKLLGLRVRPFAAWCERVSVPIVVGVFRPIILLPPSLLTGLTTPQLASLLAHELAHIRRWDPLMNVLQRYLETFLFFHPAVWLISSRVSADREECCDDMVIRGGTTPGDYAESLVRMAQLCHDRSSTRMTLAATGRSPSHFRRRVLRMLAPDPQLRTGSGIIVGFVIVAATMVAHAGVLSPWSQHQDRPSATRPQGLVAVLGEDRARFWGGTGRLVLSPDESRLFLAESLGFVSGFNTTGLQREIQFRAHKRRCLDLALVAEGTRLVTISTDGTAALWDLTTDSPGELDRLRILEGTYDSVWLRLAASSRRVVIRAFSTMAPRQRSAALVLDVTNGKLRKSVDLPPEAQQAESFALSPDGNWLVTSLPAAGGDPVAGADRIMLLHQRASLVVWDLRKRTATETFRQPGHKLERLMFTSAGNLWAADQDGVPARQCHCWTLQDGKLIPKTSLPDTSATFRPRAFAPGEIYTGVGDGENFAVSRKTESGWTDLATIPAGPRAQAVFLRNGSVILARGPQLQRCDLRDGNYVPGAVPHGHARSVSSLLFDPTTNSLLSASEDTLREWDLSRLSHTATPSESLRFHDTTRMTIWPGGKGFVLIRDTPEGNIVQGVRRKGQTMVSRFRLRFGADYRRRAWCVAIHPSKPIMATGHWDHHIRVWKIDGAAPEKLFEWKAHRGHVCDLAFSPDGRQLASAGWDRKSMLWTIAAWEAETEPVGRQVTQHLDVVRSVAFSGDGRFIASGGEDGQILLWDRKSPATPVVLMHEGDPPPKRDFGHPRSIDSLQFSKDTARLLSGDNAGRVTVWNVADGEVARLWQLAGWVRSVRFSPDESMIGTANADGTVYLLQAPKESP